MKQNIIIILLVGLIIWLWVKPKEVVELPEMKQVKGQIEYRDRVIKQIETKIVTSWKNNEELENKVNELTLLLYTAKQASDTLLIIQLQDTTINTLKGSNDTLKTIITLKDSVIQNKDYIIESKDTINSILDKDLKKVKRQRIILGGLVAILVGVGLVK